MSNKLKATLGVPNALAPAGPNTGWQDTATASWQYFDLTDAKNRMVRVECRSSSVLCCFVEDDTVTPSVADTGDVKTEDLAWQINTNNIRRFVVPEGATTLAYKEATVGGVIRVHIL